MPLLPFAHLRAGKFPSSTERRPLGWHRLPKRRRTAAEEPAAPARGTGMRLPPQVVADILLQAPWHCSPPMLAAICHNNRALTAEVFHETRLAVFASPSDVQHDRAARLYERQWTDAPTPRLRQRVLAQWQSMSPAQKEAYPQLIELLQAHPGPEHLQFFQRPYSQLLGAIRQTGHTAYGQRLFFAHASDHQIRMFAGELTPLLDARLLEPMIRAGGHRFLSAAGHDLFNETGVFARGLYGQDEGQSGPSWFAQSLSAVCTLGYNEVFMTFGDLFMEIVHAKELLPAAARALQKSEGEVMALDSFARQSNVVPASSRAELSATISFAKAHAFDFSFLRALALESPAQVYEPFDPQLFAQAFRAQEDFLSWVQERIELLRAPSEPFAPRY